MMLLSWLMYFHDVLSWLVYWLQSRVLLRMILLSWIILSWLIIFHDSCTFMTYFHDSCIGHKVLLRMMPGRRYHKAHSMQSRLMIARYPTKKCWLMVIAPLCPVWESHLPAASCQKLCIRTLTFRSNDFLPTCFPYLPKIQRGAVYQFICILIKTAENPCSREAQIFLFAFCVERRITAYVSLSNVFPEKVFNIPKLCTRMHICFSNHDRNSLHISLCIPRSIFVTISFVLITCAHKWPAH